MATKPVLALFMGLFIFTAGCQNQELHLCVTFDQIQGLETDDRVLFDKNHVGRVVDVRYTEEDHFSVQLEIKRQFAQAVTEHARFFIISDPMDKTRMAIKMIRVKKGGTPLEDGSTVPGSTKHTAYFSQTAEALEKGLADLGKQFKEFSEQLKSLPESEEAKKLKKEFEQLSEEIRRSGEAARDKMEKDVLPRLKEELERLREKFLNPKTKETEEKPLEV